MAPPPIFQAPLDTPIGRLWVAASTLGLVSITRGDVPDGMGVMDPDPVAPVLAELRDYFAGRRRSFSTTLDLRGAGPFDGAVWDAAREIPYGETVSYGELAAMGRLSARRPRGRQCDGALPLLAYRPVPSGDPRGRLDRWLGRRHLGEALAA